MQRGEEFGPELARLELMRKWFERGGLDEVALERGAEALMKSVEHIMSLLRLNQPVVSV